MGLRPGASKKEVKLAYRKLAMQYHPDRKSGSKAKFLEIVEAYEVICGLRKIKEKEPSFSTQQAKDYYNIIQKLAIEKAKAEFRQRAAKIKKQREEKQAKEFQRGILYFLLVVALSLGGYFGYNWFYDYKIDSNMASTKTTVTAIGINRVVYQFTANGERYQEEEYVHKSGYTMLADNGMPLKIGDEFSLSYNQNDPTYHRVEYSRMSENTLQRYIQMAKKSVRAIYSEKWMELDAAQKDIKAECVVLLVYDQFGLEGLAQLVFWDEALLENFQHNSLSWYFFSNDEKFREVEELCRVNF